MSDVTRESAHDGTSLYDGLYEGLRGSFSCAKVHQLTITITQILHDLSLLMYLMFW